MGATRVLRSYFGVRLEQKIEMPSEAEAGELCVVGDRAPAEAAGDEARGPRALPSPFRNLLTPLCSPLGRVSRYSWARTSNRPVDERSPSHFSSSSRHFSTQPLPYCIEERRLPAEASHSHERVLNHKADKRFYRPYTCPALRNNCLWKAVQPAPL